jgi:transcriptional regulator of acetoin/glycerol metabolism
VLNISLLRSPAPKTSQNLAMSLVTTAARRVEMANLMAESPRDWVLRLSSSPEFLDVDPEAAVRLDGSGRVLGYTSAARRLFPEGAAILGRRIDDVLNVSVDDLPDLMRDRPTEERVIEMRDGGALFGHAISPKAPRHTLQDMRRGGALAGLTGGDPEMARVLGQAERLALGRVPLLITGETGTGKTKLAHAIRRNGNGLRSARLWDASSGSRHHPALRSTSAVSVTISRASVPWLASSCCSCGSGFRLTLFSWGRN